eukprot:1223108-Prymnesium_polylepis.1
MHARSFSTSRRTHRLAEEVGTWGVTKRQQIVAAGTLAPNIKAFNTFRTWYTMYNEQVLRSERRRRMVDE